MNKIKEIFHKLVYPKDYTDLLVFLAFMMKLAGLYPIKVVSSANNIKVQLCKWGVCCTIVHLVVYLSSLIYSTTKENQYIIRPGGAIGNLGSSLLSGSEFISTFSIFLSVFCSLRFQKISLKEYIKIKQIYEELAIDRTTLIRQSRYLIYLLCSLLCIHLCVGISLAIYNFYIIFQIFPPINIFFLTTLSHFYIFMKVSHFLVVTIMLNSSYKELVNLLKVIEKRNL